jgi:hypothetical protein
MTEFSGLNKQHGYAASTYTWADGIGRTELNWTSSQAA